MSDEYMAKGLSASERAERVLFGMERGHHRPAGDEKDLYAITKASLVRAIEAAERDARIGVPAQGAPGWRCFHCDETFTDEAAAKDHFGYDMLAEPGCKLNELEGGLLGILRRQEEQLSAYHREETASYREFYSLGADHARALRREEEKGYARGVADCRSETLASTERGGGK